MSVTTCLGLDDPLAPPLRAASIAWQRWCHQDPDLAVVDDLFALPHWTRQAELQAKDAVLARLHEMAQRDPEAAVVLSWLLLPGACQLAGKLADLSPEIDALVAGALWIRVRTRHADQYVAATILRDVRRAVLIDLGIGDPARRSDPVWTRTTTFDDPERLEQAEQIEVCAESELGFLVQAAVLDGAITSTEADLLLALAEAAEVLGAPARRGRAGLTAPAVIDEGARHRPKSARSVRRQVTDIVRRLGAFACERRVDEDLRDFVATHDLPPVEMAEFLELYLWDHIDGHVDGIHSEFDQSA
jgi:hypothetical protein